MKQLSKALEWSSLSPAPIVVYLPSMDEYAVVWRGQPMSYAQAWLMAGKQYLNVFPTASMRKHAHCDYMRLQKAGVIEDSHISENSHDSCFSLMFRQMKFNASDKVENPAILAEWFNKENAMVLGDDYE